MPRDAIGGMPCAADDATEASNSRRARIGLPPNHREGEPPPDHGDARLADVRHCAVGRGETRPHVRRRNPAAPKDPPLEGDYGPAQGGTLSRAARTWQVRSDAGCSPHARHGSARSPRRAAAPRRACCRSRAAAAGDGPAPPPSPRRGRAACRRQREGVAVRDAATCRGDAFDLGASEVHRTRVLRADGGEPVGGKPCTARCHGQGRAGAESRAPSPNR